MSSTIREQYALITAKAGTEIEIEQEREKLLNSLPPSESQDLKLLLLQQKISRILREEGEQSPLLPSLIATHNEMRGALQGRSSIMETRGQLLQACVDHKELDKIFQSLTRGLAQPPSSSSSSTSSSVRLCVSLTNFHRHINNKEKYKEIWNWLLFKWPCFNRVYYSNCKFQYVSKKYKTDSDTLCFCVQACDRCATRYPQGSTMYGCRSCDFDSCPSCFGGNFLSKSAIRPNLDFYSILREILTNVSLDARVIMKLTPISKGRFLEILACALFVPKLFPQEIADIGKLCADLYNGESLKSRKALRTLISSAIDDGSLKYALHSSSTMEEGILRLIYLDLQSGKTSEDTAAGLNVVSLENSSILKFFTLNQLIRLGNFDKGYFYSQDWFGQQLCYRMLPTEDEFDMYSSENSYSDVARMEDRMTLLAKLKELSDLLRPYKKNLISFDFLLLHHRVKMDRERRKPLFSNSASSLSSKRSETNLPLLMEYLNPSFRGSTSIIPNESIAGSPSTSPRKYFSAPIPPVSFSEHRGDRLCSIVRKYFPLPSEQEDAEIIKQEIFDLFHWKDVTSPKHFSQYLNSNFVQEIFEMATIPAIPSRNSNPKIQFCDFNKKIHSGNDSFIDVYCDFVDIFSGQVIVKIFEIDSISLLRKTKRNINTGINLDGLVPHSELVVNLPKNSRFAREKIQIPTNNKYGYFVIEITADGIASRVVVTKGMIRAIEKLEPFGHVFYPFEMNEDTNEKSNLIQSNNNKIELWIDGKIFYPEKKKEDFDSSSSSSNSRIIVPYAQIEEANNNASTIAVLSNTNEFGTRCYLFQFQRKKVELKLTSAIYIDRESLINGNRQAQIIATPIFWICETKAPLALLTDLSICLNSTNDQGISSDEIFPISKDEMKQNQQQICQFFKVIPNLRRLSCYLKGKMGKTEVTSNTFSCENLNQQDQTIQDYSLFLKPTINMNHYQLAVLGKSGEPVEGISVQFSFDHPGFNVPKEWTSRSMGNGLIELGNLSEVSSLSCSLPNYAGKTIFHLPKDQNVKNSSSIGRSMEKDPIHFVFALPNPVSVINKSDFTLLELGNIDGSEVVVRDCFSNLHLSPTGTHVYVEGLSKGRYVWTQYSNFQRVETGYLYVSAASPGAASSSSNNNELRLGPGRVFISNSNELKYPVTISNVQINEDKCQVQISGGSTTHRKLHVVFHHFVNRSSPLPVQFPTLLASFKFFARQQQISSAVPINFVASRTKYVAQRNLADEIVYCSERISKKKITGNLLPNPTLIMNEEDYGITYTKVITAREGEQIVGSEDRSFRMLDAASPPPPPAAAAAYASRSLKAAAAPIGMANMMMLRKFDSADWARQDRRDERRSNARRTPQQEFTDPSLDFLSSPSIILFNLPINPETNLVTFSIPKTQSQNNNWMEIVCTDDDGSVASKNVVIGDNNNSTMETEQQQTQYLDIRHRLHVASLYSHIIEQQKSQFVSKKSKFEIGMTSTAKFTCFDTLESFFDFSKALRPELKNKLDSFSFMAKWNSFSIDEKRKLYSINVCNELNFFLKRRDPEFFNSIIRPQLQDKVNSSRTFLELFLLDCELLNEELISRVDIFDSLNVFEKALLAISCRDSKPEIAFMLSRQLLDSSEEEMDQKEVERLRAISFQTALQLSSDSLSPQMLAKQEVESRSQEVMLQNMSRQQDQYSEMNVGGGDLFGGGGHDEDEEDDEDVSTQKKKKKKKKEGNVEEEEEAEMGGDDEEVMDIIQRVQESSKRKKYTDTGPAHAWVEKQFSEGYPTFKNSLFWYQFVKFHVEKRDGGAFLSSDICLVQSSLPEALLMLGAIDAVFTVESPHVYEARREIGDMDFFPSCDCIIFHQQVQEIASPTFTTPKVLVGQTILDYEEFNTQNGSSRDKEEKEPLEILKRKPYFARVVLTNISSTKLQVKLLLQIPEGAVALTGPASQTIRLDLPPFSTITQAASVFYFPHDGKFGWFPSHVSHASTGELLAFAEPRDLIVHVSRTIVDETSWFHLCSEDATIDQVISFLETNNLRKIPLRNIAWRFIQPETGKSDWIRVVDCLQSRGIFSPEIYSFALIHEPKGSRTQAAISAQYKTSVGSYFNCPLLTYRKDSINLSLTEKLSNNESKPEVYPFIKARAHPIASAYRHDESPSTNDRINSNHEEIIRELTFWNEPVNYETRLRLVILFINLDQIEQAKSLFKSSSNLNSVQSDYLEIYLNFFVEEDKINNGSLMNDIAKKCLIIAQKHENHPNEKWRKRFQKVIQACQELIGTVPTVVGGDQDNEEQTHREMASKAPSFEIEFKDKKLIILTNNIPEGSDFTISIYKMNVEHLFSTKPFSISDNANSSQNLGQFAFVLPNFKMTIPFLTSGPTRLGTELEIPLPTEYQSQNILIRVNFDSQQRVITRFASDFRVHFVEDFGILRAFKPTTRNSSSSPVPLAYCKVYARVNNVVTFYKDGYTDVRGEFDYCALNTTSVTQVQEFSVLVSHPTFGSVIRRVVPPSTL